MRNSGRIYPLADTTRPKSITPSTLNNSHVAKVHASGATCVETSFSLFLSGFLFTIVRILTRLFLQSPFEDWMRIRCICGALLGRSQQNPTEDGCFVYRLAKYAFRPVSPTAEYVVPSVLLSRLADRCIGRYGYLCPRSLWKI